MHVRRVGHKGPDSAPRAVRGLLAPLYRVWCANCAKTGAIALSWASCPGDVWHGCGETHSYYLLEKGLPGPARFQRRCVWVAVGSASHLPGALDVPYMKALGVWIVSLCVGVDR